MNLPVDLQDFICSGFAPDDCQAASALLASASIEDGTCASDRLLRCAASHSRCGAEAAALGSPGLPDSPALAGRPETTPVRPPLGRDGANAMTLMDPAPGLGRPRKYALPFFDFLQPKRAVSCPENPRVDGSIPTLATTSNSMNYNGFRVSPADYPCPSIGDPRTIGK
jgi:hypothetical protein